MKGGFRFTTTD